MGLSTLHDIHTSRPRPRPRAGPVPRLRMARVYWALCLTCSRWGKVWIGKRLDSADLPLMGRFLCFRRLLAHVRVLVLSAPAVGVVGAKWHFFPERSFCGLPVCPIGLGGGFSTLDCRLSLDQASLPQDAPISTLLHLSDPTARIRRVEFHPSGHYLASACYNAPTRI